MTTTHEPDVPAEMLAEWRKYYACPPWCRTPAGNHDIGLVGNRALVDHDGPEFGEYLTGSGATHAETRSVVELGVRLRESSEDFTATALRQFAADALAAAEWLEAQS